jgi:hypothetical protein
MFPYPLYWEVGPSISIPEASMPSEIKNKSATLHSFVMKLNQYLGRFDYK